MPGFPTLLLLSLPGDARHDLAGQEDRLAEDFHIYLLEDLPVLPLQHGTELVPADDLDL